MKTVSTRLGIALALISSSFAANAAVFYFSDCDAGAETACVPGDNRNSGTDPSLPKRDLQGFNVKQLAAGEHTLRFARGGAMDYNGMLYVANLKTTSQSIVLTDYEAAWSASALPILRFTPSTNPDALNLAGINLINGGSGYTFRNLDITGVGAPSYHGTGFFLYRKVSNVLIDNVTVRNFKIGLHFASEGEKMVVRNSRILNNYEQGFLGGGKDAEIENSVFDNNGFKGGPRYHNIYLAGKSNNMIVRGNTLSNSAMVNGRCTGVSLVGHDHFPNSLIENNTVVELNATSGCYGIQINGYQSSVNRYMGFDGTVIRGNTVVMGGEKAGSVGIGVNACPDCVIENNTIVGLMDGGFIGINVPDGSFTSAGSKDNAITVRNNSIYMNSTHQSSVGIRVNAPGAVDDKVVSNLIHFGPRSRSESRCFQTIGRTLSSYAAFGSNLCFREGGANRWSDQHATLAAAQAAGWDTGSLNIDPLLVAAPSAANRWTMVLKDGSPAVDVGDRALSAAKDILGELRDARPDIGAFESGNKPVAAPSAPTGVVVQ